MKYVQRIANVHPHARQNALLAILREEGIPFTMQRVREHDHWAENVVVSFAPAHDRLVVGAHYNCLEEGLGAEYAGGASVLVHLAKHAMKTHQANLELVFFDCAEYVGYGVEAYVHYTGACNIGALVVLEGCGFGDIIAVAAHGNGTHPKFSRFFDAMHMEKYGVLTADSLPRGADATRPCRDVPIIAVMALPREALPSRIAHHAGSRPGNRVMDEACACHPDAQATLALRRFAPATLGHISSGTLALMTACLIDGLFATPHKRVREYSHAGGGNA